MAEIIIPKYSDESRGFQRASDWLFGSEAGYKRYMDAERRRYMSELAAQARSAQKEKLRAVDGIGVPVATINLGDYMRWQLFHRGCWEDKTFIKEYIRDNPYCRMPRHEQRTFASAEVPARRGKGRWAA